MTYQGPFVPYARVASGDIAWACLRHLQLLSKKSSTIVQSGVFGSVPSARGGAPEALRTEARSLRGGLLLILANRALVRHPQLVHLALEVHHALLRLCVDGLLRVQLAAPLVNLRLLYTSPSPRDS